MKKVLLTLAAVVMAFAANAQFVIGGDLDIYNNSSYVTGDGEKYARTGTMSNGYRDNALGFSINPRIGYQFTEKLQAGVTLGYNMTVTTTKNQTVADPKELFSTIKETESSFGFGLYGRYNFAQMGKFTVFGQLNLGMRTGTTKFDTKFEKNYGVNVNGDLAKETTLTAKLVPGLNYAISDCFSVDLYLNFIALRYTSTKTVDLTTTNPELAEINNHFDLGADMDGITIDGLTNAITIGLNWHIGAGSKAE